MVMEQGKFNLIQALTIYMGTYHWALIDIVKMENNEHI